MQGCTIAGWTNNIWQYLVKYYVTLEINMMTSMNCIGVDHKRLNLLRIQLFKSCYLSLFSLKRSIFYSILTNFDVLYRYKIAVRPLQTDKHMYRKAALASSADGKGKWRRHFKCQYLRNYAKNSYKIFLEFCLWCVF